jgi:predicted pyridoxine 5'-phosphate oxidase superfamily flavin-nucleotide-binding protein
MDVRQQSYASTAERRLQDRVGSTGRAEHFYRTQVRTHLNDEMQAFVARQEMAIIATADSQGACDCSFRAGPPGFVHVLDAQTLAFPEYRGNGVMASAANIGDNGHTALLFIDFTRNLIGLHVNGRAELVAA